MGMDNDIFKDGQTAGQLADKLGVSGETMAKRVLRSLPDVRPALSCPMSVEQQMSVAAMSRTKRTARKSRTVRPVAPAVENPAPETPSTSVGEGQKVEKPLFNSGFLKAIIYGHAVLIFADLTILYSIPGAIAGLLVGLFMHSATELADRPELNATSQIALIVCFVLDGLAWFVHVPAFRASLSNDVSDIVTQVLAGVVCLMSFAALYVVRESKLERFI